MTYYYTEAHKEGTEFHRDKNGEDILRQTFHSFN